MLFHSVCYLHRGTPQHSFLLRSSHGIFHKTGICSHRCFTPFTFPIGQAWSIFTEAITFALRGRVATAITYTHGQFRARKQNKKWVHCQANHYGLETDGVTTLLFEWLSGNRGIANFLHFFCFRSTILRSVDQFEHSTEITDKGDR